MSLHALYGQLPTDLRLAPAGATQVSPLVPGARSPEELAPASLSGFTCLAPPGTIERRYALACLLRALEPGAPFTALAPKDKGGSRLKKELTAFGCTVEEEGRAHHRICTGKAPPAPQLTEALAEGAPRLDAALEAWTQPGVFSWNRIDLGTALLLRHLPRLQGRGADLGCGLGFLTRHLLRAREVLVVTAVDIDRRAVDCARRNLAAFGDRVRLFQADVRAQELGVDHLDFVVTNPPFHDGGEEDRALGRAFLTQAAFLLRPGGQCWLVANRHLPYEELLRETYSEVRLVAEDGAYKIYEATR